MSLSETSLQFIEYIITFAIISIINGCNSQLLDFISNNGLHLTSLTLTPPRFKAISIKVDH